MTFPALLDSCTLFGTYLCDTLLRIAETEAFRPLGSAEILDELQRNVIKRGIPVAAIASDPGDAARVS